LKKQLAEQKSPLQKAARHCFSIAPHKSLINTSLLEHEGRRVEHITRPANRCGYGTSPAAATLLLL
jgi:hypothetical protein